MADFRIGDTLELADGDYLVESMAGGTLRLRNLRSQELNMIHVSAVPRLLALPPVLGPDRPGPRSFDSLPAEVAEGTRTMARHIEEVIYGKPHGEETCREEYDPEHVGLLERQRRKAVELSRLGHPVSERTIRRWVDLYRQSGPAGLVDGRQSRKDVPLGNLDIRVRDALVAAITKATNRSTGTGIRLIHEAKAELLRKYPGEEIPIPSDRSLRRHIGVLTKGKYTAGSAANRRSADNAPKRMFSARPAISPGHEVQIDSSPFDVLARGIDGRPVRAKLTIMLCKATQSIIATSVNVRGVKGVDLAFMLAQCLVPRPARPGGGALPNETELKAMPWARHLSLDEVAAYDLTRPFIKPQRIMTDNGKDYLSSTFMSACETFGVDITRSAIHTPTDKPNVERAFHTIKTKFVQYLPGNTGGSVDRRGAAVEKEDLLDIYTLAELFDRWVSVVWQNMTHEALRDPLDPRVIHSPNSMYMAMFDMTGFVPVPLSPEDYIALLPTLERTIQADGINVDYRRYDSPELGPYRLQPSGRSDTGGKWVIHYNPHNPAAVWVRHPETGEWMECRWMNKDAFEKPFSASIRRSARQITEAFGVLGDQESTEATVEMIAQTQNAKIGKARRDAAEAMEQVLAERSSKQFPRATTPLVVVPDVDILDDESYEEYSVFNPMKGSR